MDSIICIVSVKESQSHVDYMSLFKEINTEMPLFCKESGLKGF